MQQLVAVALAVAMFAGCTEADGKAPALEVPDGVDPLKDGERDLRTQLRANDTLQSPTWHIGDWWQHETTVRIEGESVFETKSVAAERVGGSWDLLAEGAAPAAWEAAFDYPLLGNFADGTLTTTYYGEPWTWYQFPLADGATWDGRIQRLEDPFSQWINRLFDDTPPAQYDVTYTATYRDDFQTPLGTRPGFQIDGMTDGRLLVQYDYVPAVGWFTEYREYRFGGEGDAWTMQIKLQQMGTNFTGTVHKAAASPATTHLYAVGMDPGVDPDDPTDPGQPQPFYTGNTPHAQFQVDGDLLFGFVFAGALGGAAEVRVLDSQNQEQGAASANGLPPAFFGFDVQTMELDSPPGGMWNVGVLGGGGAHGGGAWLWDATVEESVL